MKRPHPRITGVEEREETQDEGTENIFNNIMKKFSLT